MNSLENRGIMAGTQRSGRPGGNPDLIKYRFTTDRDEACTALLQLRIQPSLFAELKKLDGWQEIAREAIASSVERAAQATKAATTERQPEVGTSHHPHPPTPNQAVAEHQREETTSKATPTRQRKPRKPTSQNRSRKNSATATATEPSQLDTH